MPFKSIWCCKDEDNVWDFHQQDHPCDICPKYGFDLFPENLAAYQRWTQLDYTGRSRGFQEEPLREEAITSCLERYGMNVPKYYEKLLLIETILFSKRVKDREKKDKDSSSKQQPSVKKPRKR